MPCVIEMHWHSQECPRILENRPQVSEQSEQAFTLFASMSFDPLWVDHWSARRISLDGTLSWDHVGSSPDYVRKCHTFLWLIPFFPWALWPNDFVSFCFCPTENVSLKSCAQQRWSIYVQSSLVKRGYFTWRADDHEKLNRKQKLYRFKQVKWLKKSGKNIANFWLLTFFSFLQVSESFCEFRFLLFFLKSKVLTFLCFSRKAKKSANFWW